jgi:hypothetical protein
MVKNKRTIIFEDDSHLSKDVAFDVAYSMFETLRKTCPGCAMGIVSLLVSMLAIQYTKEDMKKGRIFEREEWIKEILEASNRTANTYERTGTTNQ